MRSPGINGEGELRGQPANKGSPGKMAFKTVCVCVCVCMQEGRFIAIAGSTAFTVKHLLQSNCGRTP